jgi:hypothetical protein
VAKVQQLLQGQVAPLFLLLLILDLRSQEQQQQQRGMLV